MNDPPTLESRLLSALAGPEADGPAGRAVALLLADAAGAGASDVHLNPDAEGLQVLYRLDGALHRRARVPSSHAGRFLGKIKVLAGLLTYRRDIPQDGQIPASEAAGPNEVRVSIFPTIHGEKGVLRFFLHGSGEFRLDDLGFSGTIEKRLRAAVARPDGVILLTGPSGSGKTTTIYALLHEIAHPPTPADGGQVGAPTRHVVTIEDPVERVLPGITQTQVNPSVGLHFDACLRSLLRQDPQVIMVGEIRDPETARVATEAGLTGHLVISTVHAGTASGVVSRLLEMGVEPHVLTGSLSVVLAQRLLRQRCPECRGGGGCASCHGSGFCGRRVVAEVLEVTDPIREAIAARRSRSEIEGMAVREGMEPIREAADRLVREGITTEEERARVIGPVNGT